MLNAYDRAAGRPVTGGWIALVRSGQSARGLAHARTLRAGGACGERASVLECGGPPPLWPAPNCKRTPQKLWRPFIFHSSFPIFHLKIGGFKVIQGYSRLNFFSPCQEPSRLTPRRSPVAPVSQSDPVRPLKFSSASAPAKWPGGPNREPSRLNPINTERPLNLTCRSRHG